MVSWDCFRMNLVLVVFQAMHGGVRVKISLRGRGRPGVEYEVN